jgi:glycerophosphoryl diester phosphodiesterase
VFYALYFVGLSGTYSPDAQALQTPYRIGERIIATPDFIQAARRRNVKTHVWTINDEARMRELIAAGINGIITDRPDLLLKVLGRGKSN